MAHHHLCVDMFEGKDLFNKHSESIRLKNIFDRMFLKHLTENISKTF